MFFQVKYLSLFVNVIFQPQGVASATSAILRGRKIIDPGTQNLFYFYCESTHFETGGPRTRRFLTNGTEEVNSKIIIGEEIFL